MISAGISNNDTATYMYSTYYPMENCLNNFMNQTNNAGYNMNRQSLDESISILGVGQPLMIFSSLDDTNLLLSRDIHNKLDNSIQFRNVYIQSNKIVAFPMVAKKELKSMKTKQMSEIRSHVTQYINTMIEILKPSYIIAIGDHVGWLLIEKYLSHDIGRLRAAHNKGVRGGVTNTMLKYLNYEQLQALKLHTDKVNLCLLPVLTTSTRSVMLVNTFSEIQRQMELANYKKNLEIQLSLCNQQANMHVHGCNLIKSNIL